MISTYQTRVTVFRSMDRLEGEAALAAYAELYSRVQRKLFADVAAGRPANLVEERVLGAVRDTGADVQRDTGVPGREGGIGQGGSRSCTGDDPAGGAYARAERSDF